MALKDYISRLKSVPFNNNHPTKEPADQTLAPAQNHYMGRTPWYPIVSEHFDGEKTPGEMGVIKNLIPNHNALRHRAYEANLKSDIIKIITGKFFMWVIGPGLKLQSEPEKEVLATEGITLKDAATFQQNIEARFKVFADSEFSDYQQMENLHHRALETFQTAFLGGDSLNILRIDDNNNVNIQVIDGSHIRTPKFDSELLVAVKERGNTVKHGIELNERKQHVAFFVHTEDKKNIFGKFQRIPAKGETTGRTLAFMFYVDKHRIDHERGIPKITAILEKAEKMDRYTEAVVGSAEERAKIVYSVEHSRDSDGMNPLLGKARISAGMGNNAATETSGFLAGEKTAATIAATTSKQTFNMPIGASLKALASVTEAQYETFSRAVFNFLCAGIDIPPEVALQLYGQNYSGSRAAINGWDYIVKVYRKKFAEKFYKKFYQLWFEVEVRKNKIPAPGYLQAIRTKNIMITEAYTFARFTGVNQPHIDPLKEVKAIRAALGNKDDPLISREDATEKLGFGDWEKNNQKYNKETPKIEIKKDEPNNSQE